MVKKLPKLLSTTVVFPKEYDLDKQIRKSIQESNTSMDSFPRMDIGKIVGLYMAYSKLEEELREEK